MKWAFLGGWVLATAQAASPAGNAENHKGLLAADAVVPRPASGLISCVGKTPESWEAQPFAKVFHWGSVAMQDWLRSGNAAARAQLDAQVVAARKYLATHDAASCLPGGAVALSELCTLVEFSRLKFEPAEPDSWAKAAQKNWNPFYVDQGVVSNCDRVTMRDPAHPGLRFQKCVRTVRGKQQLSAGWMIVEERTGATVGMITDRELQLSAKFREFGFKDYEGWSVAGVNSSGYRMLTTRLADLGIPTDAAGCGGSRQAPTTLLDQAGKKNASIAAWKPGDGAIHVEDTLIDIEVARAEGLQKGAYNVVDGVANVGKGAVATAQGIGAGGVFAWNWLRDNPVDDPENPGHKIGTKALTKRLLDRFGKETHINFDEAWNSCAEQIQTPSSAGFIQDVAQNLNVEVCVGTMLTQKYGAPVAEFVAKTLQPCFSGDGDQMSRCIANATAQTVTFLATLGTAGAVLKGGAVVNGFVKGTTVVAKGTRAVVTGVASGSVVAIDVLFNQLPLDPRSLAKQSLRLAELRTLQGLGKLSTKEAEEFAALEARHALAVQGGAKSVASEAVTRTESGIRNALVKLSTPEGVDALWRYARIYARNDMRRTLLSGAYVKRDLRRLRASLENALRALKVGALSAEQQAAIAELEQTVAALPEPDTSPQTVRVTKALAPKVRDPENLSPSWREGATPQQVTEIERLIAAHVDEGGTFELSPSSVQNGRGHLAIDAQGRRMIRVSEAVTQDPVEFRALLLEELDHAARVRRIARNLQASAQLRGRHLSIDEASLEARRALENPSIGWNMEALAANRVNRPIATGEYAPFMEASRRAYPAFTGVLLNFRQAAKLESAVEEAGETAKNFRSLASFHEQRAANTALSKVERERAREAQAKAQDLADRVTRETVMPQTVQLRQLAASRQNMLREAAINTLDTLQASGVPVANLTDPKVDLEVFYQASMLHPTEGVTPLQRAELLREYRQAIQSELIRRGIKPQVQKPSAVVSVPPASSNPAVATPKPVAVVTDSQRQVAKNLRTQLRRDFGAIGPDTFASIPDNSLSVVKKIERTEDAEGRYEWIVHTKTGKLEDARQVVNGLIGDVGTARPYESRLYGEGKITGFEGHGTGWRFDVDRNGQGHINVWRRTGNRDERFRVELPTLGDQGVDRWIEMLTSAFGRNPSP